MEVRGFGHPNRSREEIIEWFRRRKAWYQATEERAHAQYEEELRLKQEAKELHKYDLEYA